MEIHEYIYQTGECLTFGTDAGPTGRYDFNVLQELIAKGSGSVPRMKSVHYAVSEFAHGAHLSVTGRKDELILMAEILPYVGPSFPGLTNLEWAVMQWDIIAEGMRETDWPIENKLPKELVTPCLVTLLMPRMIELKGRMVDALRDFRRDLACVWLLFGK